MLSVDCCMYIRLLHVHSTVICVCGVRGLENEISVTPRRSVGFTTSHPLRERVEAGARSEGGYI